MRPWAYLYEGVAPRPRETSGGGLGLEDRLDLERDLHLVTEADAAALERHAEGDAEVAPVDLGRGGEAGAGVTERRVRLEAVDLESRAAPRG